MRYYIDYAGCTIAKVFIAGVPTYEVWEGTRLVKCRISTLDEAKRIADNLPRRAAA